MAVEATAATGTGTASGTPWIGAVSGTATAIVMCAIGTALEEASPDSCTGGTCFSVWHGRSGACALSAAASALQVFFAQRRLLMPRQPEDSCAPQRRHGSPDGDGRLTAFV